MNNIVANLPTLLYSAEQLKHLDNLTITQHDISGITLMRRAADFCLQTIQQYYPQAKMIIIICGSGNNAGDGYLLAVLAKQADMQVSILYLTEPTQLTDDARLAYQEAQSQAISIEPFVADRLAVADVVIDAILGSGLNRLLSPAWLDIIATINSSAKAILSVDIPSGIHADTGAAMPEAIKADYTASFIGLSTGLLTNVAPTYVGHLVFSDLGVPVEVYQSTTANAQRIDYESIQPCFVPRVRHAHKGHYGHVLLIGGDFGYAGSVSLAGRSALRVGAGLVSIATREHAAMISVSYNELMAHAIEQPNELKSLIKQAKVIGIGMGLGQSRWAQDLLKIVLSCRCATVFDADALNLLALEPSYIPHAVFTPHPGEAARMLNVSTADIQADRILAASQLQNKYGGVMVLKGCGSVVMAADQPTLICSDGNPGMATGGMGDLLTGIIAGLIAQGFSLYDAAKYGVCLHAKAADQAAQSGGERGLQASDLLTYLRQLVNP